MAKRNDSCSNVGTRYNEIEQSRCNLCVQTTYQTKNSKHLKKIHESILRNTYHKLNKQAQQIK